MTQFFITAADAVADFLIFISGKFRKSARALHEWRLKKTPIRDRMIFAAYARCPCGAGLAYDPAGDSGQAITGYWDCSAILLGEADKSAKHTAQMPFAFYEIKSELQNSVKGATTREVAA